MKKNETEMRDALRELQSVVDMYQPLGGVRGIVWIAGGIAFVALSIAAMSVIGWWAELLLVVAFLPFLLLEEKNKGKGKVSNSELAETACQLMSLCINLKNGKSPAEAQVLCYGINGNLDLYKKFISLYPYMASFKLKSLASKKIKL